MKYNSQSDARWSSLAMTEGIDQYEKKWKDIIGSVGCFVTAMTNINQEKSGIEFTPNKLNELLINHNGYFWLAKNSENKVNYYGNIIEVKCENASFLYVPVLEGILLFDFTGWLKPWHYEVEENTWWIARIENQWGGHYINVLYRDKNNNFVCFDTLTGIINYLPINKITFLHKIKFR